MPAIRASRVLLAALLVAPTVTGQLAFPVSTPVQQRGLPAVVQQIGTVNVRLNMNGKGIFADFRLDPTLGPIVDGWYDFLWVNVERFYVVNGQLRTRSRLHGTLPAIAPQDFRQPTSGGRDCLPFVHTPQETRRGMRRGSPATYRAEGQFTSVAWSVDNEPAPTCQPPLPCTTKVGFETYLVAYSTTAPNLTANEICVLAGFDWEYEQDASAAPTVHRVRTGVAITAVDGAAIINAALANAAPAFPAPGRGTGPWTALSGCVLQQCPRGQSFGTLPSQGIPEGYYAMSAQPRGTETPGIVFFPPDGFSPIIPLTPLRPSVTGAGAQQPSTGAKSVVVTGLTADIAYVGTTITGGQPAPFERAELRKMFVDSLGNVVSDTEIDSFGGVPPNKVEGYVGLALRYDGDIQTWQAGGDVVALVDRQAAVDGSSPFVYHDVSAGRTFELPISGTLPSGTPIDLCVDPTGSTIYALYLTASGGEIVAVPADGGVVQPVASNLPAATDTLACHPRTGILHLTGFSLLGFRQGYVQVDPVTGTVTDVANNLPTTQVTTAMEEATGDLIMTDFTTLRRMTTAGTATVVRSGGAAVGWGSPTDLAIVPSPVVYGDGTPGAFAVEWDLPPQRAGGGGAADLPLAGNRSFAVSLSANGWDLAGIVVISTGQLAPPGFGFAGVDLLVDLTAPSVLVPAGPGPAAVVALPLPARIGRIDLFAQGFFAQHGLLVASPGLKITTIP